MAEGLVDLGLSAGVKPWDLAPAKILLEEAGGCLTDLAGAPTIASGAVLASNGRLHEPALRLFHAR